MVRDRHNSPVESSSLVPLWARVYSEFSCAELSEVLGSSMRRRFVSIRANVDQALKSNERIYSYKRAGYRRPGSHMRSPTLYSSSQRGAGTAGCGRRVVQYTIGLWPILGARPPHRRELERDIIAVGRRVVDMGRIGVAPFPDPIDHNLPAHTLDSSFA